MVRLRRQIVFLVTAAAVALVPGGCRRTQPPAARDQLAAPAVAAKDAIQDDPSPYPILTETSGGKVRVYLADASGGGRTLIRCTAVDSISHGPAQEPAWRSREAERARLWLACKSRVSGAPFPSALAEHDAWLETAERLEDCLATDPDHLGVLRDLVVAYVNLLGFEIGSPLGANLCLAAGSRVSELESRAAPLDPADRQLVDQSRALLFQAMKLYPCAAELLNDSKGGGRGNGLRLTLAALGQDRFVEVEREKSGPLTVSVFRTEGKPPDPGLLWEDLYFVVHGGDRPAPEKTVAYVLARQGPPGQERYYLYFRALDRSRLISLFGPKRPSYEALRKRVLDSVSANLAAASAGDRP